MSSRNARFPTLDALEKSRCDPERLRSLGEFVAFWLAVTLPFVYLPLLAGGLSGWQAPTFLLLFALNVFALILGHDYGRDAN